MVWLKLSLVLIALFGIGYILVSRDISKNHGLVLIGALAKMSFFVFALIYFFLGDVNILIVLLGGIDILMAILFVEFLINSKE